MAAMNESRFLNILYGVLSIPLIAIACAAWFFLFVVAQSQPPALLALGSVFVVWLVFVLEAMNHYLFGRRALPWLPFFDAYYSLGFRYIMLFLVYVLLGFAAYRMSTETW
jgi:FtsH-binding integral membrane protein